MDAAAVAVAVVFHVSHGLLVKESPQAETYNDIEAQEKLERNSSSLPDGEILDPNSGSVYSCYIEMENTDKLKVRGYIGFSLLGRTQYWYRVK